MWNMNILWRMRLLTFVSTRSRTKGGTWTRMFTGARTEAKERMWTRTRARVPSVTAWTRTETRSGMLTKRSFAGLRQR